MELGTTGDTMTTHRPGSVRPATRHDHEGTAGGEHVPGVPGGPAWAVRLLGGFAVEGPDGAVHLTVRERRVVAYLGLHGGQARAVVAGTLWPEADEHRARQNLRAAVSTLARVAPHLVRTTALTLALDARVDVRDLVAAAQEVLAGPDGGPPARLATLGSTFVGRGALAGDLLPGWYEDWVLVEAERVQHLRLHALEELSLRLAATARYGLALEVALAAVALDPLRESAHRAVIEIHASEGNVATALATHERFRARLARELRIAPSPQMDALVDRLRGAQQVPPRPARPTGRPAWAPQHRRTV